MEHSKTTKTVFFKTTALLCYLALLAYLLSQNLQRRNTFSFLKIKDKNSKDSADFLFLIIVRHPKVVTLVYSPKQFTKSLTPSFGEDVKSQKAWKNYLFYLLKHQRKGQ